MNKKIVCYYTVIVLEIIGLVYVLMYQVIKFLECLEINDEDNASIYMFGMFITCVFEGIITKVFVDVNKADKPKKEETPKPKKPKLSKYDTRYL